MPIIGRFGLRGRTPALTHTHSHAHAPLFAVAAFRSCVEDKSKSDCRVNGPPPGCRVHLRLRGHRQLERADQSAPPLSWCSEMILATSTHTHTNALTYTCFHTLSQFLVLPSANMLHFLFSPPSMCVAQGKNAILVSGMNLCAKKKKKRSERSVNVWGVRCFLNTSCHSAAFCCGVPRRRRACRDTGPTPDLINATTPY